MYKEEILHWLYDIAQADGIGLAYWIKAELLKEYTVYKGLKEQNQEKMEGCYE